MALLNSWMRVYRFSVIFNSKTFICWWQWCPWLSRFRTEFKTLSKLFSTLSAESPGLCHNSGSASLTLTHPNLKTAPNLSIKCVLFLANSEDGTLLPYASCHTQGLFAYCCNTSRDPAKSVEMATSIGKHTRYAFQYSNFTYVHIMYFK